MIAARLAPLGLVLLLVAMWQALSLWLGDLALASPGQAVGALLELGGDASILPDLQETGRAFLIALVLAISGGLAIGLVLASDALIGEVAEPMLVTLGAIPKVTLYPVILLLFGLGIAAKVAFGVLHGIVPVALLSLNAFRRIRPIHRRTARVLRLGRLQAARTILLPAALPEVFSGLRIGTSLTILGVIVGELFASQKGVGFLLMTASDRGDTATVAAIALFLTVVSVGLNAGLLAVERHLQRGR